MAITVKNISVSGEAAATAGKFDFSYNVSNGSISNISATLRGEEEDSYLGSFSKDEHNISINIPTQHAAGAAAAIADFAGLCDEIAEKVAE